MQADVFTLDSTWRIQIGHDDGSWSDHDQTEYTDPADVHRLASQMYGGLAPDQYRLVRIDRTVIQN